MIEFFRNILRLLWKIWFYILFTGLVFLFAPILLIVTLRESWYSFFFKILKIWAKSILFCTGFYVKKAFEQKTEKGKSYMFIANHTSILDVLLMLSIIKNPFVFVGKQELAKVPIFGFFYKRTCILVDRSNLKSKQMVYKAAQKKISAGFSICIFPEGMVTDDMSIVLSDFKNGAFRLAIEHNMPIVPLVFYDCKKRFPYIFFRGMPGLLRVKINSFISTSDLCLSDVSMLNNQCFELILSDLRSLEETI
ncbi:lysophospholipid acyltransferase family protein [Flavicella sp.]|uniref:lysophospholipid acyltransferase family protein n=1 Tax=Flavicella sp. TaxID=2957742 RepID=UPI003018FDEC